MTMSNTKIISIPFVSYFKRIVSLVTDWGTLLFIVVIPISFVFLSKYLALILFLFLVYYFIIILYEARIYITEIISYDNEIEIFYFFKNTRVEKFVLSKKNFSIDWFDSTKGNIKGARIIIYGDNKKIIQYSVGKWTRVTLQSVFEKLKK